jgi:glycosyltransferase involved in cell wall biosynthesis
MLLNASVASSTGGVRLLENLLEVFFSVSPTLEILLYLNPAIQSRFEAFQEQFPRLTLVPHRNKNWLSRFYWEQVTLPQIIQREKINLLFSFANTGPRFPGCRQVLYVQQSLPYGNFTPVRHRLRWAMICGVFRQLIGLAQLGADRIVVPTRWLVEPLRRSVGNRVPAHRYVVSPPGIPGIGASHPEPSPQEQALIQQIKSGQASGERILFYPCFPAPYKNIPMLLEAFALLQAKLKPPVKLLLTFNRESPEYFPCKQEIFETFQRLNLDESVLFCGTLSPSAVHQVYTLCDAMLFPSQVETIGLPLLEAMAQGAPIVSADTPFAREICQSAAIYAKANTPAAFAEAIEQVLIHPAQQSALRDAGLTRAGAFSWEAHARTILGLSEPLPSGNPRIAQSTVPR